MKFYLSYWSRNLKKDTNIENKKIMMKICVNQLRKYYNDVNLITDENGKEIFKNINWTSIDTSLENLPKNYKYIWALGKIMAYKLIAEKNEPFIHLDYDIFLIKKFSEKILNSEIIMHSKEIFPSRKAKHSYGIEEFYNQCPSKYIAENSRKIEIVYNTGIVGGKNYLFFKKYSELIFNILYDKNNQNFWKNSGNSCSRSLILDQYYLTLYLNQLNIKPNLLFEEENFNANWKSYCNKNFLDKAGFLHLEGKDLKNKFNKIIENDNYFSLIK
jgi:hypothetical protein